MATQSVALAGKVAVITGSTRGIGRAIAEAYGRAGAQVMISSSRADAVAQTVADLRAAGIACAGVACNVSEREQVQELCRQTVETFGQVHIWVNNAAISGPFGYTLDVPPDAWEQVIRVNLLGCYYGCAAVLPHMIAQRYGKIINVTGGGFKKAQRFLSAYSTSKAGIVRMSEGLARDYAEHRFLAINVLAPGIVPTDMTTQWDPVGPGAEALKAFPKVMKIFGTTAEETAELALRMASDATDGVSGKVFEVMPRRRALWRIATAPFRR
jgi:NAD(P)-dependent dehydrogenase (short-subunit alcohol dehydrogenase family)